MKINIATIMNEVDDIILLNPERFDRNDGTCKCYHITEGTCKQCTACDGCKYYFTVVAQSKPYNGKWYFYKNPLKVK